MMKEAYDNSDFTLESQDFTDFQGTEQDMNKAFVKKTSYIILSKMNKTKKSLKKRFEGEICLGDWYSFTNYLQVLKINKDSIEVKNQRGMIWTVSNNIVEKMYSGNHYEKEICKTRTELVEILKNAKDTIFTVTFNKKVKPEEIVFKIKEIKSQKIKNKK